MSRWSLVPAPSEEFVRELAHYPRAVVSLLASRGVTNREEAERFMQPDFGRDVHDPFLFTQMRAACERMWQAFERGETIAIHGDYDADGISGSVLLTGVLKMMIEEVVKRPEQGEKRATIVNYHPHREKDGYGIRTATLDRFAEQGVTLMVTVDCGISCAPEIAHAATKGIDTIVVDHHEFNPEALPKCVVLHPRIPGETYPFKYLAAVGVAYKFSCALVMFGREKGLEIPVGYEKWLLDLVAVATVTDVMPLKGENRALEKFGLMVLNKTRRTGLRALIEVAGLEFGSLDTMSVGFGIGPRINAASRMDHADAAVRTLLAEDPDEARLYAEQLNDLNKARQKYTEEIMTAARQIAKQEENVARKSLVIKGEGWMAGIVGLVAGKLLNEFGKPVYVFGVEGEKMVGSGRAVGFNVVTAMERSAKYLHRFGGHPQACGLTILGEENFEAFSAEVEKYAHEIFGDAMPETLLEIDAEISVEDITIDFVEMIGALAPFGEGNRMPRFLLRDLVVSDVVAVGKTGSHVQVFVRQIPQPDDFGIPAMPSHEIKMIGFFMADQMKAFSAGSRIDVIVELGVNEWRGRREPQVKLCEVAAAGEKTSAIVRAREKEKSLT